MVASPSTDLADARQPDLLIAFGVKPAAYEANNGYVVSEQGKPPDFVIEIASESTASIDVGDKRDDYAALGILEYWRFDKTGEFYGARLAGDRLVDGAYEPIPIDELDDDVLQGYSAALNLILRWEQGQLGWYDPATESTYPPLKVCALSASPPKPAPTKHVRPASPRKNALTVPKPNSAPYARPRLAAEARIQELEQRLQQQGS